jgi:hypothetical protein
MVAHEHRVHSHRGIACVSLDVAYFITVDGVIYSEYML